MAHEQRSAEAFCVCCAPSSEMGVVMHACNHVCALVRPSTSRTTAGLRDSRANTPLPFSLDTQRVGRTLTALPVTVRCPNHMHIGTGGLRMTHPRGAGQGTASSKTSAISVAEDGSVFASFKKDAEASGGQGLLHPFSSESAEDDELSDGDSEDYSDAFDEEDELVVRAAKMLWGRAEDAVKRGKIGDDEGDGEDSREHCDIASAALDAGALTEAAIITALDPNDLVSEDRDEHMSDAEAAALVEQRRLNLEQSMSEAAARAKRIHDLFVQGRPRARKNRRNSAVVPRRLQQVVL